MCWESFSGAKNYVYVVFLLVNYVKLCKNQEYDPQKELVIHLDFQAQGQSTKI